MHTFNLMRRCWIALLMLMLSTASFAHRDRDDDGDYQIVHARYGTAERHIDVTPRLKELARQDRRFKLVNEVFGYDPAPGERKVLRIFARGRNGQMRTFEYEEYSHVDGNQFTGWDGGNWGHERWSGGWGDGPGHGRPSIEPPQRGDEGEFQILQARYGTAQRNVDVTARLKELARQDRRFKLVNDQFGIDPAPGERKSLRIYARGRAGQVQTFEYEEYGWVDGAQFTGWGGGNWGHEGWNGSWGGEREERRPPISGYPAGRQDLQILRATYGASGRDWDVTERLRALSRGSRGLEVYVDNVLGGGDPYPGQRKILIVSYRIGNSAPQEVRVSERDTLRLP
ncbi:hypothetical protein RQP53_15465 [Paucibacter sp. APW11]|uniref:DnaJ-like protein C11 C-terminal domain-containing protein n=1 Tax=Roseateles aquae TaxID=3077235 RepID=A0ABU3PEZ7_9BURK|nr:hypothetical protein [Paucibacter sp. APW11]MDT9000673.1 hypothetical protein [Paucibacter sp. APW11]